MENPKFFNTILCFVTLLQFIYFFRKAVLRKLFDIWFSYNHCNFSPVCLLVKIWRRKPWQDLYTSKTPLLKELNKSFLSISNYCGHCHFSTRFPRVLLWSRYSISLLWCTQLPNSQTLIKFASAFGYLCDQRGFTVSPWRFLIRFNLVHGVQ